MLSLYLCAAQICVGASRCIKRAFLRVAAIISISSLAAGCLATLSEGPDRLYSVQEETDAARLALPDLMMNYNAATEPQKSAYRNEIIGQRVYVIDVQFSKYDEALTKESQEAGFIADATSQGLNTAGTLFTPAQTTKILGGVAGAVTGVKGAYQNDILIAKTIQIIQTQMHANRDAVSARILTRMAETTKTYPLSIALSDVEDYYRAGTLTEGLVQTSGSVNSGAKQAQITKEDVVANYSTTYSTDAATDALWNYLYPSGRAGPLNKDHANRLNTLLADKTKFPQLGGKPWIVQQVLIGSGTASIRLQLARLAGLLR